jgi:HlyD family type I secretion membrane fusion protein
LEKILVKEGEKVITGQPLIYLNNTAAKAKQGLLSKQLFLARASEIRLESERDNQDTLVFSQQLLSSNTSDETQKIVDSQQRLFKTKQSSLIRQKEILNQRISQLREQQHGFEAKKKATAWQLSSVGKELKTVAGLVKKGIATEARYNDLERQHSQLEGTMGELTAEIARIHESIAETKLQILNLKTDSLKDVMVELKETQQKVSDLQEQVFASSDVLERTVITAPLSGRVTGLQYHTIGGVVTPGAPIMDIVPDNDTLIVEARIRLQDIDIVREGLDAKVMLSAYKSRFVPRISGKVLQVSADSFKDERTGESYYLARVSINKKVLEKLSSKVDLYPGMPAEVFITTGERTLLQYLASPLINSFHRAFKEE